MTNTVTGIESEISKLEQLTTQVAEALVNLDPNEVQRLVIEQCESMKRINGTSLSDKQVDQMRRIAEMVVRQQALVDQAVKTADYFIKHVRANGSYNQVV